MKFLDWFSNFIQDKVEVATNYHPSDQALHSKRRFICQKSKLFFEFGRTYTDRLVLRSGPLAQDGVTIDWGAWQTLHDIEMS